MPGWTEPAEALESSLSGWIKSEDPDRPSPVLVGPPGSGISQIISLWAKKHSWKIIEPPSPRQVLAGDTGWLSFLDSVREEGFVLPDLEKLYLRHHSGLTLIRRFLDELWRRKPRCLVGCNSWAWSYLCHAVSVDSFFSAPLSLQAFDKDRLTKWLCKLACESGKKSVSFRQSSTGKVILTVDRNSSEQTAEDSAGTSTNSDLAYFERIAARSRGIPLVAWALWRNSLLVSVQEIIGEEAQKAASEDQGMTIWVRPWEEIVFPEISPEIGKSGSFILHTLLLHGGLGVEVLNRTLSLTQTEIEKAIVQLQSAGLIKPEADSWRLTLSGYPAVRSYLQNEEYLVDAF